MQVKNEKNPAPTSEEAKCSGGVPLEEGMAAEKPPC